MRYQKRWPNSKGEKVSNLDLDIISKMRSIVLTKMLTKKNFFWNIKKLVSIHECPVAIEDYKMNTNNAINNIVENSNIKEGIILSVEGLNNEAYESSTDYLENVQQTHIEKLPTIINDTKHNNNDIVKNKMTNQNNINTKSTNNHNRKYSKQISKSGNNKMKRRASIMDKNVRESMKKSRKNCTKMYISSFC